VGIGWFVNFSGEIARHDGGTGSYYSFAGFDKQRKVREMVFKEKTKPSAKKICNMQGQC
jgi:hypothetical protein